MEPAVELGVELVFLAEAADGYTSGGARVRGEDLVDRGDAFAFAVDEVVVDQQVEGDGAPEGLPPLGEDGCPKSGLGGEAGDNDLQNLVGEVADEVEAHQRLFQIWLDPPSLAGRLGLHLSRPPVTHATLQSPR